GDGDAGADVDAADAGVREAAADVTRREDRAIAEVREERDRPDGDARVDGGPHEAVVDGRGLAERDAAVVGDGGVAAGGGVEAGRGRDVRARGVEADALAQADVEEGPGCRYAARRARNGRLLVDRTIEGADGAEVAQEGDAGAGERIEREAEADE